MVWSWAAKLCGIRAIPSRRTRKRTQRLDVLTVVELNVDLPEDGLAAGTLGTVVHLFDTPRVAYEVEFVDSDGNTVGTATVTPDQLRPPS